MIYQSHGDSHMGGEVPTMHLCTFVSEEYGKGGGEGFDLAKHSVLFFFVCYESIK
jgi:hypothetical protein